MNDFVTVKLSTPTMLRHHNTNGNGGKKLRVVTLNYLPSAYKFVTDWINENGHEHVLAVTSPGIKTRATPAYKDVLPLTPPLCRVFTSYCSNCGRKISRSYSPKCRPNTKG